LSGDSPRSNIEPLCPGTGRRMPAMRPATRLRHFQRESLIARLPLGEASIVTGGSRRATGRNDLDDAQRAIQSKGDLRGTGCEPGADADWTRMVHGHGLTACAAAVMARTRSRTGYGQGQDTDADCFRAGRGQGLDKATVSRPSYVADIPCHNRDHFPDSKS
jgi:hypothetical protein